MDQGADNRSRLPPRQLPLLAAYAYAVTYVSKKGWIDRIAAGKAGTALLGVLTMGESSSTLTCLCRSSDMRLWY